MYHQHLYYYKLIPSPNVFLNYFVVLYADFRVSNIIFVILSKALTSNMSRIFRAIFAVFTELIFTKNQFCNDFGTDGNGLRGGVNSWRPG